MTLKDLLAAKNGRTITVSASASVAEAIRVMHDNKVGAVLIPDAGGCPVGIFTERDVVRVYAEGDDLAVVRVEERMTCSVVVGKPEDTVDEVMALMTERRFRHLPVLDKGKLIGLVSIGDVVKAKLDEAAREAQTLREYIHS
ncbi:CBS domain-containing protein [Plasticicumulans acidivorans]|nr:CBS domain-containing protein [Plasticicumulans acidivorans]